MTYREKIEVWVDREISKGFLIGNILLFIRKTGISANVRRLLVNVQYEKERKHPTHQMNETKKYFLNRNDEVNANISLLADDLSKEVYKKMIEFRFTHDKKNFPSFCVDNSYFVDGITPHETEGVFIDCGAFTGDSTQAYLKYNNGKYKRIVCFEPDAVNYTKLRKTFSGYRNIEMINVGVWNQDTELSFCGEGSASSVVDEVKKKDTIKIKVCSIDNNEYCKDATFIKMDIEGSEYNALCGAVEVIRKNRPFLAICIYHSDEDMIRLIQWIENLKLNYSFYVRQHSFDVNDTVLYAVPN